MKFKVGETYTAVNGKSMTVRSYREDGTFVAGHAESPAESPAISLMYEADGTPQGGAGWQMWTIYPRPTPSLAQADWRSQMGEAREARIEVDPYAQERIPHKNITDRLAAIERVLEIYRRSNDGRLAKMDETHALDVTATDARLDRLSGMINDLEDKFDKRCTDLGYKADGAHTRIGAVSKALQGTDHEGENVMRRLDTLERNQSATKTFITAMNEAINKLEKLPGLATLNAAVVKLQDRFTQAETDLADRATMTDLRQVHSRLNRLGSRIGVLPSAEECAAAGPIPTESKRRFAGGWVNIYWSDQNRRLTAGAFYDSKEEADKNGDDRGRIACIAITRITEGDGL